MKREDLLRQNLVPIGSRSAEERRELGRRGGLKSGTARRRKRTLRQAAGLLLYMAAGEEQNRLLAELGVDEPDRTNQMAALAAVLRRALEGDLKSLECLRSLAEREGEEGEPARILITGDAKRWSE